MKAHPFPTKDKGTEGLMSSGKIAGRYMHFSGMHLPSHITTLEALVSPPMKHK